MRCLRCDVHYRISIILMHPSWLLSLGRSSNRPLSAGIACLVYVKRELYDDFVDVATDSVACGVAGVGFNKGGAAVSATHAPSGAALLFVSAHFAAHQDEVDKRNADFRKIDRGLFSGGGGSASSQGGSPTGGSSGGGGAGGDNRGGGGSSSRGRRSNYSASAAHDLAFWAGDFNYRIEGNRAAIDTALELGLYEVLAANDQLAAERKAGRVFGGFEEGKLAFMPTYKFDPGSDEYDTSAKARIPSWTDRVLWRLSATGAAGKLLVSQLSYHAVTAIKTSDHRAVAAAFEVRGRGSREQDGAAAGRGGQAATGGCGGGGACAVQ